MRGYIMNIRKWSILVFSSFLIFIGQTGAQILIHGNAADVYDAKAIFVNPAVIPYQGSQFLCGMKVYHLGLLRDDQFGFKNTFLGYSNPNAMGFGFGLAGQFFSSPILNETKFDVSLSKCFMNIFSVGISLRTLMIGYNRENFQLVHEDDPVFRDGTSKTVLGIGGGLACIPFPNLVLGVGAQYLNQPDISLVGDKIKQQPDVHFGIVYSLGNFRTMASVGFDNDRQLKTNGFVETFSEELGYLRVGLRGVQFAVEGLLHVWSMVSLNYSYDYPMFSAQGISQGSHMMGLVMQFDRLPRLRSIKTPPIPRKLLLEYDPEPYIPMPRYEVLASTLKLDIVEKKLRRTLEEDLPPEVLSRLSWFDIVKLDSSISTERAVPFNKQIVSRSASRLSLRGTFSKEYHEGIGLVSDLVQKEPKLRVDIVTPMSAMERAKQVRSQVVFEENRDKEIPVATPQFPTPEDRLFFHQPTGLASIPERDSLIVLSIDSARFEIIPIYTRESPQRWRMVIEDDKTNRFKVISGVKDPPKRLSWDWKNDDGELIPPGVYTCYLEWMDQERQIHRSQTSELFVKKFQRTIHLRISHKRPKVEGKPNEINMFLKK